MTASPREIPPPRKKPWAAVGVTLVLLVGVAVVYQYIVSGGLRARQMPSALEARIAHRLVDLSIPRAARDHQNPLGAKPGAGDLAAGRTLFQKNCEICHGYDGNGRTDAGNGLFPPPRNLNRSAIAERKRTDGELFYLIREGVRNTGMPSWQLTDQQTWQLVSFIRQLPITAAPEAIPTPSSVAGAHYAGSASCRECHTDIYNRWSRTPMANVVRDPRAHPDAIIPDLATADPKFHLVKEDIALVYGSIWKQRYFKKDGDDYFVYPTQWDVKNKAWKPYVAKDDWWAKFYPADNFKRPTSALCDGCHSVNFDIKTKTVTEWNVGCEKCHGPGSEHVAHPVSLTILSPARMDYVAANDSCIQCHSQGQPLRNPIEGKHYDWPVGYELSGKLSDSWKLEEHKLGETSFTHFGDGTAHKNRMQGNDYVTSRMYEKGVTCFTCHDAHGTDYESNLRKPADTLCLDCHAPMSPSGPRAATLEAHTHHAANSTGSSCIACHMPKIATTLGDVNVRSHTFRFVTPAKTDSLKIPNACNVCHTDKSTAWAADALKTWTDRSPWRMAD